MNPVAWGLIALSPIALAIMISIILGVVAMGRRERNPVVGSIRGRLDTGKGSKAGELSQDEIDEMEAKTERIGRLKPAARMLDEMRSSDPTHKRHPR